MEPIQELIDGSLYISGEPFYDFFFRLIINIISTFVIIRFIYYPKNSQIKYLFTFFLMGMMIFLIASILDQVNLGMGFALGLFAIFGIVRFRSPSIDLKEMTYLFLIIGMSMINALVEFHVADWIGLFVANAIVIVSTAIMEGYRPKNQIIKRLLVITLSDYSILNNNERLLEEVKKATGIEALRVDIVKINKVKNEVNVWVFFNGNNKEHKLDAEKPLEVELLQQTNGWESNFSNDY
jgi:hypothetical protein